MNSEDLEEPPVFETRATRIKNKVKHFCAELFLSPLRFLRFLCLVTGVVVVSLNIILGIYVGHFFNTLPDIDSKTFADFKKDAVLRVHAQFKTKKDRKRYFWTSIDKINREFLYSVVMSEDGEYFSHNGVNFNSMIDSLARNIRKREYDSGASTITQQVVKNVYLSNDKSIKRKIKEILIARDLEQRFTKNQILEVYLNIMEIGPQIYGVGMGSYKLFKKSPKRVNAKEGAFLALMLPSPRKHYYSIFNNKFISKKHYKKMNRILRDMRYLEYLSPKQYTRYRKYKIFR